LSLLFRRWKPTGIWNSFWIPSSKFVVTLPRRTLPLHSKYVGHKL
jgi:hypothetical protein